MGRLGYTYLPYPRVEQHTGLGVPIPGWDMLILIRDN